MEEEELGSLLGHPRSHGLMLPHGWHSLPGRQEVGSREGEEGGEIAKLETQEMQKVDELPLLGRGKGRGMGIAKHNHNRINFPLGHLRKANRKFALFRKSSIL